MRVTVEVGDRPAAAIEAATAILVWAARALVDAVDREECGDRELHRSGLLEDLAQLRGEGIGVAGLAVLAAEEPGVVAGLYHGDVKTRRAR